jgi:Amt family ammonium transporter
MFAMYQLMFAIITPALSSAQSLSDEIRSSAFFCRGLMFAVYFPIAHGLGSRWVDEWSLERPSKNHHRFAGGTVVHDFGLVGAGLVHSSSAGSPKKKSWRHTAWCFAWWEPVCFWVGYGFNAEARLHLMELPRMRSCMTLSTAVASFTWAMLDTLRGKPSVQILFRCCGRTRGDYPAGICRPGGAVIMNAAGIVPFFACTKLKSWLGYDDALDTFGVHAGRNPARSSPAFATASVNPNLLLASPERLIRPRKTVCEDCGAHVG